MSDQCSVCGLRLDQHNEMYCVEKEMYCVEKLEADDDAYKYGEPVWMFDKDGHRVKPDGEPGCDCWLWNERGQGSTRMACPECWGEDIYGTERAVEGRDRRRGGAVTRDRSR